MQREQFKNLVKSVKMLMESERRRNNYFGYGGEEFANFRTAAEMGKGADPMGIDDPAGVESGLFKGSTPVAPHGNASTSMGAHPSMVPKIQAKEFGASGKQLSLASYMPHRDMKYNPYPYLNDPVIRDNLHELPPEVHSEVLKMAKNVLVREPESIRNLGRFLVQNGVDPAHPHVRGLFANADFHEEHNKYSY
jgi:hypothetical protein